MILGLSLIDNGEMPLNRYVETTIYKPLGLKRLPSLTAAVEGFTRRANRAATELHGNA